MNADSTTKNNLNYILNAVGKQSAIQGNAPSLFSDRQKQYYANATQRFNEKYAKYASDFFGANVQGLNIDDPTAIQRKKIRVVNTSVPGSSVPVEDAKTVYFADPSIDYVPKGAKFWFYNSCWLATNPDNSSSVLGNTVVRRCDALWKTLDYYGNIVSEPFVLQKTNMDGANNEFTQQMVLAEHYARCTMQYNSLTSAIRENDRVILGNAAYSVTGLNNFTQEFTDDETSVKLIYFALHREEPGPQDDMVNKVADGKSFSWNILVSGASSLTVGQSTILTAASTRNGEAVDTEAHTVSYTWSVSDSTKATVSENGTVTALAAGNVTVYATLTQNTDIKAEFALSIDAVSAGNKLTVTPDNIMLAEGKSVTLTALYTENGQEVEKDISWSVNGSNSRSRKMTTDGRTATITCYLAEDEPITVTAKAGDETDSATIYLIGE